MKLRLRDLFRNYALPGAIGFAVFLALTGGRVLDTADLGWLRTGDLQQHFLGWHFFRNTEFWQSPLGSNRDFGMELGSSIVYTDSLPLLAIPLKAIHTWLPDVFQYIGWWILACFLLQAALAWRLIGRFTGNWWLQACATAFFCLSPPFLFRLHGHDALFGHWIVLSALLLYFSAAFFPARWLALLLVAALTHAYLLILGLAVWAADNLTRLWHRTLQPLPAALWAAGTFAALVVTMWQAGYFMLSRGALSGGGYGFFRMDLLSLVSADGFWSKILFSEPYQDGKYEGFNYLGLGTIVLAILTLGELLRDRTLWQRLKQMPVLLGISVLLTLYAISNQVFAGSIQILSVPLPAFLVPWFDIFRASGRLFWVPYYLIYLGIFFVILTRYPARVMAAVLPLLLLVQTADSWRALREIHDKLHDAEAWSSPLTSPFWNAAARRYDKILYVPPRNAARDYFPLGLYAATQGMAINTGAFARMDTNTEKELTEELIDTTTAGKFDPKAIYVFETFPLWNEVLPALGPGDAAGIVDRLRIVAPGWGACDTCQTTHQLQWQNEADKFIAYTPGSEISFKDVGNSTRYAIEGWSRPEQWGTWSDGDRATVGLSLESGWDQPLTLQLWTYAYVRADNPVQNVEVLVNGTPLGSLEFLQPGVVETRLLRIPRDVASARLGAMLVEFRFPNAIVPSPADPRRIALGVTALKLAPEQAP